MNEGKVTISISNNIGTITFFHPKSNSLPGNLLKTLTSAFHQLSTNEEVKVIVLKSEGDGAFCAGASFNELLEIIDLKSGKDFFMGFAHLILAMKKCSKFIITRVQGKAVGGGVGLIAASDYVMALESASIKLSELELGIGPFVVGPVIEKKIGIGAFAALSIDTEWRDAHWSQNYGLISNIYATINDLDKAVSSLAVKLSKANPQAMKELKSVLWKNSDWDNLLETRAEISGRLVLSEYTRSFIADFKNKK